MTKTKDLILKGNAKDLGGFSVVRSLPQLTKKSVGPFIFFDHLGPMKIDSEHFLDVRPHPHIGLSTVTYLFEGRGYHRDSLGSEQIIEPGDINLMTAGRGIVHSERTPCEDLKASGNQIHGIQVWMGLPKEHEDCEPSFSHSPKQDLPEFEGCSFLKGKVMMGSFASKKSPVVTKSPTLFVDLLATNDGMETLKFEYEEVGLFFVDGKGSINGSRLKTNDLIICSKPSEVRLDLKKGTRLIVLGGSPFTEPRYIWWNFVSSEKEKIRAASKKWKKQEMGQVKGETDFIPLPDYPMI